MPNTTVFWKWSRVWLLHRLYDRGIILQVLWRDLDLFVLLIAIILALVLFLILITLSKHELLKRALCTSDGGGVAELASPWHIMGTLGLVVVPLLEVSFEKRLDFFDKYLGCQ